MAVREGASGLEGSESAFGVRRAWRRSGLMVSDGRRRPLLLFSSAIFHGSLPAEQGQKVIATSSSRLEGHSSSCARTPRVNKYIFCIIQTVKFVW